MQQRLPPGDGHLGGLAGIELAELGIPSETEFVNQYCSRRGLGKIEHWNFYLSFSFFRLAAILQGVAKRGREGNASSDLALDLHKRVEPLASMAISIANNKQI